jgi:hypothetical protein
MASHLATRLAALAAMVLGVAGMARAAHADIGFTNVTDESLVFNLQCPAGSLDTWRIAPHSHLNIYCTSGARAANIAIRTTHRDGRAYIVRGTVYDGRSYAIGHDDDGDVSFERLRSGNYY